MAYLLLKIGPTCLPADVRGRGQGVGACQGDQPPPPLLLTSLSHPTTQHRLTAGRRSTQSTVIVCRWLRGVVCRQCEGRMQVPPVFATLFAVIGVLW